MKNDNVKINRFYTMLTAMGADAFGWWCKVVGMRETMHRLSFRRDQTP